MSETQINDKDFESIPLEEIILCRFCSQSTEEDLIEVCKCQGVLQWVHFSCLSKHIKTTVKDKCALCKARFTGIHIEFVPLGFLTFIKTEEDIIPQIACSSLGFAFLYYVLYLALIDFILSDGLIHVVMRILLIGPTIFYAILFTGLLIGLTIALFIKYEKWRKQNFRIEVNKNAKPDTTVSKTGTEDQKQKTNVCVKSEETSAKERVAIDMMEVTDKSDQTLKVNTADDNRNNVEIRQKGQ